MLPASRRLVVSMALASLLVVAGCTGTSGPTEGTATTPDSPEPERPSATAIPATTGASTTETTPATTNVPTTSGVPVPTEELGGPPYDVDEFPLVVWIYGVHYERLRNATFTYERERRSTPPGADRRSERSSTIHIGADGREHWTHTLYGVGSDGSVTIEDYRDGEGLQYERGPDPETEEIEYLVFEHEDDLFAETLALGPKDARFAFTLVDPGASNLTYGGTRTIEGERLHVYAASNVSKNRSVDVTLLVTDRGIIRRAETRWSVERPNGTSVVESIETYRDVNETTVAPPDWLDEARAAADR